MIQQILVVSFSVPVVALLTLIVFLFFKNLRAELQNPFKEVTAEWLRFMSRGIPIPTDYKRIEAPFAGEPVLTQPELQVEMNTRVG